MATCSTPSPVQHAGALHLVRHLEQDWLVRLERVQVVMGEQLDRDLHIRDGNHCRIRYRTGKSGLGRAASCDADPDLGPIHRVQGIRVIRSY